jgi:hypothetical protein
MTDRRPAVTFGMIVLNGLPFLPYNLRALYPYAHQIIVVEGAVPGAAALATTDGHSRDGTLEELTRFARDEDPDGKLTIVTAESDGHTDGFWPGEKDEQSRAYAARATGDYLWQVDVDEFYLPADMESILIRLARPPELSAVTFPTLTFWGGLNHVADGWYLRRGASDYHRLFRWGPGYTYATHRPPTVLDALERDTRTLRWLDARAIARMGIIMRHYSLLFPFQAREKVEYYSNWGLYAGSFESAETERWLRDSYLTLRRPYRVHNVYRYPSWLEPYRGPHPPQIVQMMSDIDAGRVCVEARPTDDVTKLLGSPTYMAGRELLRLAEPLDRWGTKLRRSAGRTVRGLRANTGRSRGG